MNATHIAKDNITISFGPDELAFLSNAINEAMEAVEDWEFQTRTGETPERAREIQAQLGKFLEESQQAGD